LLAPGDGADGADELARRAVLEQEAEHPRLQGCIQAAGRFSPGEDQHLAAGQPSRQLRGGGNAIYPDVLGEQDPDHRPLPNACALGSRLPRSRWRNRCAIHSVQSRPARPASRNCVERHFQLRIAPPWVCTLHVFPQATTQSAERPAGVAEGPDAVTGMLARYTATRLPRTTDVVRWSRRAAAMTTWASPPAVTFRNTLALLTGKLAPTAALRALATIYDWQPPPAARPGNAG
jgi:hypothetical protein